MSSVYQPPPSNNNRNQLRFLSAVITAMTAKIKHSTIGKHPQIKTTPCKSVTKLVTGWGGDTNIHFCCPTKKSGASLPKPEALLTEEQADVTPLLLLTSPLASPSQCAGPGENGGQGRKQNRDARSCGRRLRGGHRLPVPGPAATSQARLQAILALEKSRSGRRGLMAGTIDVLLPSRGPCGIPICSRRQPPFTWRGRRGAGGRGSHGGSPQAAQGIGQARAPGPGRSATLRPPREPPANARAGASLQSQRGRARARRGRPQRSRRGGRPAIAPPSARGPPRAPRQPEPRGLAGEVRSGESGGPRRRRRSRERQVPAAPAPAVAPRRARPPRRAAVVSHIRPRPASPGPALRLRPPPALAASATPPLPVFPAAALGPRGGTVCACALAQPAPPAARRGPAARGACAVGAAARRMLRYVLASGPGAQRPLALLPRGGGSGDGPRAGAFGLSRQCAEHRELMFIEILARGRTLCPVSSSRGPWGWCHRWRAAGYRAQAG